MKFANARTAANGKALIDIAIPSFGFIRKAGVTHGARHDGSQLREVVTTNNTASDLWTDTAYRPKTNEACLAAHGRVIRIHRNEAKGQAMLRSTSCTQPNQFEDTGKSGARLCAAKGANGVVRLFHRDQAGRDQDHAGQSGLQYSAPDLPRTLACQRIVASKIRNRGSKQPPGQQY